MKILEFDAVVIGTGCAGFNVADSLYSLDYKNIAIITEGINLGTSRNTGSDKQTYYKLSLSGDEGDSVYKMAETYFATGSMDGDVALAEASNSVRAFIKLANLGVDFPTNNYGEYVGYKTDHDPYFRATSIGPYTSKKMTEVLEKAVVSKGIKIIDKAQVIKLLVEDKTVTGLLAIDLSVTDKVEYIAIKSSNVVIATGGPASIYFDSVYPVCHTGFSSLALDAGADFYNLSEWQYGLASIDFRWNVSGTYQQVLPRYISIDENGVEREFLLEYMDKKDMIKNIFLKGYEWPFDVRKIFGSSYIDLLVYNESVIKGRKVYMDFTREPSGLEDGFESIDKVAYDYLKNSEALIKLPIERLRKMNKGAIDLYKQHNIDIEKEPLRIAVCAQHNNGGIGVDSDYKTNIKGLFASGECAGTFGIFRPGGSALNSTQVSSLRVAEYIKYKSDNKVSKNFDKLLNSAINDFDVLIKKTKGSSSTVKEMRTKYQKAMSENFAFIRDLNKMGNALSVIESRLECFENDNKWENFVQIPQLIKNLDIIKMQRAVAKSMIYSAENYGSRGSGFVIKGGSFLDRSPVKENEIGRNKILLTELLNNGIKTADRDRKPIPQRDLWFEKVWNEYKKIRNS